MAQSSIAWGIDSIVNPHLTDDSDAIIAFPDETFGLGYIPVNNIQKNVSDVSFLNNRMKQSGQISVGVSIPYWIVFSLLMTVRITQIDEIFFSF
jgi:hypothetical protein